MTQPFEIDTSVLVRLTTRDPEGDFQRRVEELRVLVEDRGCEIFASNQVIGEAYVAVQRHYRVSDEDAGATLIANDYSRAGMEALTLDRRMSSLPRARRL